MHVIGTAGHVDHGKSSLVEALTGTHPDRWAEERLRGMTLDLGFAHLRFDDGVEAGIVDVPGHERFLHNMLAGAAGVDVLLLVVDAREGPREQTREHLAILSYLDVRAAVVALTKSDLVDAAGLDAARAQVAGVVRGTVAERAPVIAVSSRTGVGIEALRTALHDALVAVPPRPVDAPAYLPVDRVFALAGHGTIVTGTLAQGRIATGDELVLQPSAVRTRVRSLQSFGVTQPAVAGGTRVAAALPGVAHDAIRRGEVLCGPEFVPAPAFRVRFTPHDDGRSLLRRRTPVRAYVGAAEILGTLVFERAPVDRGAVDAMLYLRRPVAVYAGAPFVVRSLSPKRLLGGGRLGAAAARDDADAPDAERERIATLLAERGLEPATAAELALAANVREERIAALLDELADLGRARRVPRPTAFVDAAVADAFAARAHDVLAAREREAPWIAGTTSLLLARSLGAAEPLVLRLLAPAVDDGRIALRAGYYATPGHVPRLSDEQRAFFDGLIPVDAAAPLVPADLESVVAELRRTRVAGASAAFDALVATGALVKVGAHLYRGSQVHEVRARLETTLRSEKRITMARFRDLVGTSRKYAVPLLEHFDATGFTARDGDVRFLRSGS